MVRPRLRIGFLALIFGVYADLATILSQRASTTTEIIEQTDGTIPSNIDTLFPNLTTFDYDILPNTYSLVPPSLALISSLRVLRLTGSYFSGTLPNFGAVPLTELKLRDSFTGTLPTWIGTMTSLVKLDLESCKFVAGPLFSLSALTNLQTLRIVRNWRNGELPDSFGGMTSLQHLDLSSNSFTGNITNHNFPQSLTYLNLSKCNLYNSPIPASIYTLGGVIDLSETIFKETNTPIFSGALTHLNLRFNNFLSPWPIFTGDVSGLNYLDLSLNSFRGTVPSYANLAADAIIKLNRNSGSTLTANMFPSRVRTLDVSGIVSLYGLFSALGATTSLENLICNRAWITDSLNSFPRWDSLGLKSFSCNGARLSGTVPSFGPTLETLDLSGNELISTIPALLGNSPLTVLNLAANNLQGVVPASLCNIPSVDVSNNTALSSDPVCCTNPATFTAWSACACTAGVGVQTRDAVPSVRVGEGGQICPSQQSQSCSSQCPTLANYLATLPSTTTEIIVSRSGTIPSDINTMFPNLRLFEYHVLPTPLISVEPNLAAISTLKTLRIYGNNLVVGSLPDFSSVALTELTVHNALSGTFPQWIANINSLVTLDFESLSFNTPLPNVFGSLVNLQTLRVVRSINQGPIPNAFGGLSLKSLDLSRNQFVGSIGTHVFPQSLEYLNLSSANLYNSPVPASIYSLGGVIDLSKTLFSETNTPIFSGALTYLDLNVNNFLSPWPIFTGNVSQLGYLNLAKNSFRGVLPSYAGLQSGATIILDDNSPSTLSPNMFPSKLTKLSLKSFLNIDLAALAGTTIDHLYCGSAWFNNRFDSFAWASLNLKSLVCPDITIASAAGGVGTVPDFGSRLEVLDLSNNDFIGTLPPSFCGLPLTSLNLNGNNFDVNYTTVSVCCSASPPKGPWGQCHCPGGQTREAIPDRLVGPGALTCTPETRDCCPPLSRLLAALPASTTEIVYNTTGTIPSAINTMFPNLVLFEYNIDPSTTSTIPSGFASIPTLQVLRLRGRYLKGSLPNLGGTALRELTVHNALSGPFPTWIASKTSLIKVDLLDCDFTIAPLSNIGLLTNLQFLRLSRVGLSGQLPDTFGALVNLQYLDLSRNSFLSGPIGGHSFPQSISYLNLSQTEFYNSPVPPSIYSLSGVLDLSRVLFASTEQPIFSGALTYLNLRVNNFLSPWPVFSGDVSGLKFLDLGKNSFRGTVPSYAGIANDAIINLDDNSQSYFGVSPFPTRVKHLSLRGFRTVDFSAIVSTTTTLESLDCSNSDFDWHIGANVWGTLGLKSFVCPDAAIPFVPNLGPQLEVLNMAGNQIVASIPYFLTKVDSPNLKVLDLSRNKFVGYRNIFCGLPSLEVFNISFNVPPFAQDYTTAFGCCGSPASYSGWTGCQCEYDVTGMARGLNTSSPIFTKHVLDKTAEPCDPLWEDCTASCPPPTTRSTATATPTPTQTATTATTASVATPSATTASTTSAAGTSTPTSRTTQASTTKVPTATTKAPTKKINAAISRHSNALTVALVITIATFVSYL